jgi:hypothetical protein
MFLENYWPDMKFLKSEEKNFLHSPTMGFFCLNRLLFFKKYLSYFSGKKLKIYNVYKNIDLLLCGENLEWEFKISVIKIKNKKIIDKNKGLFLEIWQKSIQHTMKKITLISINKNWRIWDLKLVTHFNKNKNIGFLLLLSGSKILIIEMPRILPPFLFFNNFSFELELLNIFQWNMDIKKFQIATGDISGKIIFINLKKKFSWIQLQHNLYKKTAIGSLKLITYTDGKPCRFLLSGGFDGYLKIWNINESFSVIQQIFFSKRWVLNIIPSYEIKKRIFFFLSLDNGIVIMFTFDLKFCYSLKFSNKGGSWKFLNFKNLVIIPGKDGTVNFLEFDGPNYKLNYLNFVFSKSPNFRGEKKYKLNDSFFQIVSSRFFIKNAKILSKVQKKLDLIFLCKTGLLITMNLSFEFQI